MTAGAFLSALMGKNLDSFKETDYFTSYIAKGIQVNVVEDLFAISIV